jgi:hypothetical protein
MAMNDTKEIIGTTVLNGEMREVAVIRAASGKFWTARGPFDGDRDYATRVAAVKFLKRTHADESLAVAWSE